MAEYKSFMDRRPKLENRMHDNEMRDAMAEYNNGAKDNHEPEYRGITYMPATIDPQLLFLMPVKRRPQPASIDELARMEEFDKENELNININPNGKKLVKLFKWGHCDLRGTGNGDTAARAEDMRIFANEEIETYDRGMMQIMY